MRKILLIEDDEQDGEWISSMLSDAKTTRASTMEEGITLLRDGEYDAVLLDLSLPDCDGLESVSTVHTFDSQTPIIVLTGRDDEALALEAIAAGAHDFLVKGATDARQLRRALQFADQRVAVERRMSAANAGTGLARGIVMTSGAPFLDMLAAHVKDAGASLIVAADRPGQLLDRALRDRGLTGKSYLDLPKDGDLEAFSVTIEEQVAKGAAGAGIVVDSVNSLFLRFGVEETLLFCHTLANRMRLLGVAMDLVVHDNVEWPLVAERMSFLDGFVHLADPAADPSVA